MTTASQARIDEIRKRTEEYRKHKNDPYAHYPEEIYAIREVRNHAVEGMEFLFN